MDVFESLDGGATWRSSGTGLPGADVRKIVNAGVGRWLATTGEGIYRTTDGGVSWSRSSISNVEPSVFDLAAAPSSGIVVYAATAAGGFLSLNAGVSWQPMGPGFPSTDSFPRLAVDPTNLDRVYAVSQTGFYRSIDGGRSWAKTGFQIFAFGTGGILDVAIDPNRPQAIYVSDLFCALGCATALRRSDDGGDTSAPTLGASRIPAVVVDSGSVVIAATSETLQRSFDRGATWEAIGRGIPLPVAVLASSRSSSLVVAGTRAGQLYATTDHGTTWRALTDPAPICVAAQGQVCVAGRFRVSASFIAPGEPQQIAQPVSLTENAAAFWFFSANNLEIVVKVVDGRAFNGRFWVFLAGLSDVDYLVSVTDSVTGSTHVYANARGQLRSQADTNSF